MAKIRILSTVLAVPFIVVLLGAQTASKIGASEGQEGPSSCWLTPQKDGPPAVTHPVSKMLKPLLDKGETIAILEGVKIVKKLKVGNLDAADIDTIYPLLKQHYTSMDKDKRFADLESAIPLTLDHFFDADKPVPLSHYYLYLPKGYDRSKRYPLLVFLHGNGPNLKILFWLVSQAAKEQFIILAPTSNSLWWEKEQTQFVLKLVKKAKSDFSVDDRKVFIMGWSNGGCGALTIGLSHGTVFSGVISVAGFLLTGDQAKELPFTLDLPAAKEAWPEVYLFHGEKDDEIRPERGRAVEKLLGGKGLTVRAKFYEDQNHFIFLEKGTGFLPACFESFLRQPKKSGKD